MTPERKGSQKFSRSEKIYNRRKKAEERQNIAKINERIEINANLWQLAKVRNLLSPENPKLLIMNDMEKAIYRASLEIEKSWWELKCNITNSDQQKEWLTDYMNTLQHARPDVHKILEGDEVRPSMARQIHNKVFPPIYVGGRYYAKR